jgi:hypothetical protein
MTSLRDAQVQELIAHNERLLAALKTVCDQIMTLVEYAQELIAQAEENEPNPTR